MNCNAFKRKFLFQERYFTHFDNFSFNQEELLRLYNMIYKLKIYKIRYEMILNIKKKRARFINVRRRGEIDGRIVKRLYNTT